MESGVVLLWLLAVLLTAAGLAGLILPVLPGPPMIFAGLVLAAWAEGFVHVGYAAIAIMAVLAAAASLVDFLAGVLGARHFGASRKAMAGALAGVVVGLFFGIPGIVAGPFIGAVIGELAARKPFRAAGLAGVGTWLGMVIGAAAKVALGALMIGVFLVTRFL